MANIITITTVLGSYSTNCYIVANTDTREAVIIDPAARGDYIIKSCEDQKFKVVAILLTHGHYDHIGALEQLRNEYPDAKVYAGVEEEEVLKNPALNLSELLFGSAVSTQADIYVDDAQKLELLGTTITCLHVPGHTKGGTCYYFEEEKLLFSGDTLFNFSVGRSDFPTGNEAALLENISSKLLVLPDDVVVYAGHNNRSTIGREKKMNPFFTEF